MTPFSTISCPATRFSLVGDQLRWAAQVLRGTLPLSSHDDRASYERAQSLLGLCQTVLGERALRFSQKPLAEQAQAFAEDEICLGELGRVVETLTVLCGMKEGDWWALREASPALRGSTSFYLDSRQGVVENAMTTGVSVCSGDLPPSVYIYPWGQISSAILLLYQAGDQGRISSPSGHYVSSFSNPDFGDHPHGWTTLNEGLVGVLEGNVHFFKDPRLNAVAVPSRDRELFASQVGTVILAPVAQGLKNCFPPEMARALLAPSTTSRKVHMMSAVKGLNENGMTALEYIKKTLSLAPSSEKSRRVSVMDVLGYYPVKVIMQKMAKYRDTGVWEGEGLELVLACPDEEEALSVAKRWCRVGADKNERITQEERDGKTYLVLENKDMVPPLKILLLTDPQAIRANELASIYKNLMGLKLGRELFQEILRVAEDLDHPMHSSPPEDRSEYFQNFYQERQRAAEEEIYETINLDLGIKNAASLVLKEVRRDLYGSWTVTDHNKLYNLVGAIFENTPEEAWERAMIKFKFEIGAAFTVRNILFGFSWAANKAAVARNRWVKSKRAAVLMTALKASGELSPQAQLKATNPDGYFFFSLIPDGLTAEGVSIAENMSRRYKRNFRQLPDGVKEAARFVQRIHHETFLGLQARKELLDLSQHMAVYFSKTDLSQPEALQVLQESLMQLDQALQHGLAHAETHKRVQSGRRARLVSVFIRKLRGKISRLRTLVDAGSRVQEIQRLVQELLVIMAKSNRLDIVPPEAAIAETGLILEALSRLEGVLRPETGNPTAEIPPEERLKIMSIRTLLTEMVMSPMTEAVWHMNQKLHSQKATIQSSYLIKVLREWQGKLETVQSISSLSFLSDILREAPKRIQDIIKVLKKGGCSAEQRTYLLQALIEWMTYNRSLFVVDAFKVRAILEESLGRLQRIHDYLIPKGAGKLQTPFV